MAWYQRAWNVLRPERVLRDLDRELSFHIRERTEELEAGGMQAAQAEREARRQFGNYTSQVERTRDMDVSGWMEAMMRDFRLAFRTLLKAPAFTATVVLTLALGIGANTAVFSAIYAVLLKPLPFPNGDQLLKRVVLQSASAAAIRTNRTRTESLGDRERFKYALFG